jgi:hypothetical protein
MQIDESDVQNENALSPMWFSRESAVNTIVSREVHCSKHFFPINPTDEGKEIEISDSQREKASSSIRRRCEFDSNDTTVIA